MSTCKIKSNQRCLTRVILKSLFRLTNLWPSNSTSNLNLEMLAFEEKGKTGVPGRKTSRSKDENQQQTQPTYDAESGNQTQATLVGDKCSHHCATPAPHNVHSCHIFPCVSYATGLENLIKYYDALSMVIICSILINLMFDKELML